MPNARARRAFGATVSALLAGLGAVGCREAPTLAIDLVELLPLAELVSETQELDFGTPDVRAQLVSGWSGDETTAAGRPFVWGLGERSVVRLVVGEPRDLKLRFRCWPATEFAEPQRVTLSLAGTEVAQATLAPRAGWYEAPLPKALLVAGENDLELHYSAVHARPGDVGGSLRGRAVGWDRLRVENARSFGPPSGTSNEPARLRLPIQSLAVFYVLLPEGGTLELGSPVPWAAAGAQPPAMALEVALRPAGAEAVERSRFEPGAAARLELPASPAPLRIALRAATGVGLPQRPAGLDLAAPRLRTPAAPGTPTRAAPATRANVLIYLIDTLRADHLGVYGYHAPTSPNIDAFAGDATRFERALAQSSWTRPAVASLFTGLDPRSHGVVRPDSVLSEGIPALAGLLRDAGYATHAVVTNGNLAPAFGFGRGFDEYRYLREVGPPEMHRLSDRVGEVALGWLGERRDDRPFLLYLHTTDPHAPYAPRAPQRRQFAADVRDPELGSVPMFRRLQEGEWPHPDVNRQMAALYDAEIAFNDASFGSLLAGLRELDLYDPTLIVLLSDHGEAFADHGSWQHGNTLYEELTSVPLVIRLPSGRGAGRVVGEPVRQIDVLPTLLDALGIAAPTGLQGRSLLPLFSDRPLFSDGRRGAPDVPAFAHLARSRGQWESVVQGHYKLIRTRASKGGSGRLLLFDLDTDPAERRDLSEERPVWRGYLESQLRRQALLPDASGEPRAAELDPELRQRLEALGYL